MSLVLEPLLCQAEKERAENFKLPRPRTQFIATRGGLRLLLSHYLGVPASQLIFSQTAHGKPVLPAPFPNIHFNVSHSGHQALIAITQSTPIGVDIEVHQDLKDLAGLLGMIAHPRELSAWQALSCAGKASEFYRLWTLKEALSKALGRGLSLDFRKLEIGMDCGGPPKLIKLDDPADDQGTWQIQPLEHEPGYSAALATAPGVSLRRFELKILNN